MARPRASLVGYLDFCSTSRNRVVEADIGEAIAMRAAIVGELAKLRDRMTSRARDRDRMRSARLYVRGVCARIRKRQRRRRR
jgi:hypothetical protein